MFRISVKLLITSPLINRCNPFIFGGQTFLIFLTIYKLKQYYVWMLSDLFQREFSKYQLFIIFTRMKNGQSWVLKTMKTQVSHLFVKIGSRTRSLIILHFALNLSARNIVSCMGFTGCESTFCYNLILCLADGYSSKFWTRYLQDQSTGSRQQSLLLKCLSEKWRIAIKWLKLGSN